MQKNLVRKPIGKEEEMIIFYYFGCVIILSIIIGEIKYRIDEHNNKWKIIFNREMSKKLK